MKTITEEQYQSRVKSLLSYISIELENIKEDINSNSLLSLIDAETNINRLTKEIDKHIKSLK